MLVMWVSTVRSDKNSRSAIGEQPPTYDLARPGQDTIGLDTLNEAVLKALDSQPVRSTA
jgi:hypothetical protein